MQIDTFVLQSNIFRAIREASGGRISKLFLARILEIFLPLAVLNRNGRPLCGGYAIG
jgi:hypothetical protein